MGPEGMKEGDLYFAVLQKDGTPGEWQKWEGFTKIEEIHEATVGDVLDTLTVNQMSTLKNLMDIVIEKGSLNDMIDICRYYTLSTELDCNQQKVARFFLEIARKVWLKRHDLPRG